MRPRVDGAPQPAPTGSGRSACIRSSLFDQSAAIPMRKIELSEKDICRACSLTRSRDRSRAAPRGCKASSTISLSPRGGRPGQSLARRLLLPVGKATLLRAIPHSPELPSMPRIVGVDLHPWLQDAASSPARVLREWATDQRKRSPARSSNPGRTGRPKARSLSSSSSNARCMVVQNSIFFAQDYYSVPDETPPHTHRV
jgi:hypothetical protein